MLKGCHMFHCFLTRSNNKISIMVINYNVTNFVILKGGLLSPSNSKVLLCRHELYYMKLSTVHFSVFPLYLLYDCTYIYHIIFFKFQIISRVMIYCIWFQEYSFTLFCSVVLISRILIFLSTNSCQVHFSLTVK